MHIGIFTIIKNEHEYLEEWLQYHLITFPELSKIYVFDDPFSKSHKEICDRYDSTKIVHRNILTIYNEEDQKKILERVDNKDTIIPRQIRYMYTVLNYLKNNTNLDWVFYIDVDEFITLQNKEYLSNIISNYNSYDVLVLSWMNFGANGHLYRPDGGVVDNYTKPCPLHVGIKMSPIASSKCCFNLKRWDSEKIITTHHIPTKAKWCKTNFSVTNTDVVYDKIYIRHYITKSLDEFLHKLFIRGQFMGSKNINYFFYFNLDMNKEDPKIQEVINKYRDMYYSGKLHFSLF